jgi:hypothetical protein
MKPIIVSLFAIALFASFPSVSLAQYGRYGRSGVVMSPYGPLYHTRSPESRMSGGNIFIYRQLMEAKMMARQQQLMMRQQQMMMRQQRKSQQARRSVAGLDAANAGEFAQQGAGSATRRKRMLRAVAGAQNALAKEKESDTGASSTPKPHPVSTPSATPPN